MNFVIFLLISDTIHTNIAIVLVLTSRFLAYTANQFARFIFYSIFVVTQVASSSSFLLFWYRAIYPELYTVALRLRLHILTERTSTMEAEQLLIDRNTLARIVKV